MEQRELEVACGWKKEKERARRIAGREDPGGPVWA